MKQSIVFFLFILLSNFAYSQCYISEIHYNGSTGNKVEITCTEGVNLGGFFLGHINGADGTIISTANLPGVTIPFQGYDENTALTPSGTYVATLPLQDDAEGLALYSSFGAILDFVSYEGEVIGSEGVVTGMTATEIGVSEPSSAPASASVRKELSGWIYSTSNNFGVLNSPLPVKFSQFNAIAKGKNNQIAFTTESEINNDYFDIERSNDGMTFLPIGKLKGAGGSESRRQYTFMDEKPLSGVNYYRVKQVDLNGEYEFSEIVSVNNVSKSVTISTYNNIIKIKSDADNYDVAIYNVAGQLMSRHSNQAYSQNIDIENLQSGIYFVHVKNGSEIEKFKILK